jgi:hypothetical protein
MRAIKKTRWIKKHRRGDGPENGQGRRVMDWPGAIYLNTLAKCDSPKAKAIFFIYMTLQKPIF